MEPVAGDLVLLGVSKSLKNLIRSQIPELRPENRVVFNSPGEMEPASHPQLSLFLYQIMEDPYLKNQPGPLVQSSPDGPFEQWVPPMVFSLNYMMVPFAQNPETELLMADQLKRLFYNRSVLQGDLLMAPLRETGNTHISIVPNDLPIETIHNIWMGFPQKPYRLSLFYKLVPTRVPSGLKQTVTMVGEVQSPQEP